MAGLTWPSASCITPWLWALAMEKCDISGFFMLCGAIAMAQGQCNGAGISMWDLYQVCRNIYGFIPGQAACHGARPWIPVRRRKNLLLQITLAIWPSTAAKHLADFCPKFFPLRTIACSNQMESLTTSVSSATSHVIDIRYYLSWDLAMVGQNL